MMTAKTRGQVFVDSEEEMLKYFKDSEYVDCRINGYPAFNESDRQKPYPSLIFIDLDLSQCTTCKYPIRKLDYLLKQTLRKIEEEIGGYPTVLWTGGGYHIYQPIKLEFKDNDKVPLESVKEFQEFVPLVNIDLTTEFMRFTEQHLTNGKHDPKHNPSTKSCLLRIPGTLNSKHKENVKIIQKWDGKEADAKSIILPFLDHLIRMKIEYEALIEQRSKSS